MRVNIHDIAKAAGVSTATVSRVVSGKPGVSDATIQNVQNVIEEMGYRPNISARGLASKKTGNIALVSSRTSNIVLGNPFFSTIIDGISSVLDKMDYNTILSFTPSQQQRLLENHYVDGIIVLAARIGDSVLEFLDSSKIPTVFVGSYLEDSLFPCVRPNDEQGIYTAVKYLIQNGHKDITLLNGPRSSIKSRRCEEGFLLAMKEGEIELTSSSVIQLDEYDSNESFITCDQFFSENEKKPTAIISASDYLALGALKASHKHKISIPEELSIIGFGNVPLATYSYPELTTMHTDLKGIGKETAKVLTDMINGKKIRKKQRVFDMEIVERDSVKKRS